MLIPYMIFVNVCPCTINCFFFLTILKVLQIIVIIFFFFLKCLIPVTNVQFGTAHSIWGAAQTIFTDTDNLCILYQDTTLKWDTKPSTSVTEYPKITWYTFLKSDAVTKCTSDAANFNASKFLGTKWDSQWGTYCILLDDTDANNIRVSFVPIYQWIKPVINIKDVNFENNTADDGGALAVVGASINGDYSSIELDSSYFKGNIAQGSGGAIYKFSRMDDMDTGTGTRFNAMGTFSLNNVTITQNKAKNGGGLAVLQTNDTYLWKSAVRMEKCSGGGVYLNGSNFENWRTYFKNNTATNGAGLTHVFNPQYNLPVCTGIYYSRLVGNKAIKKGGSLFLELYGSTYGHGATCFKMFGSVDLHNNASAGADAYISLLYGTHEMFRSDSSLSILCDNAFTKNGEDCKFFRGRSGLEYLCAQTYDLTTCGLCCQVNKERENGTVSAFLDSSWTSRMPNTEFPMNPGASMILQMYGWDRFGNLLPNTDWAISVKGNSSLTVTTTIKVTCLFFFFFLILCIHCQYTIGNVFLSLLILKAADGNTTIFPLFVGTAKTDTVLNVMVSDDDQVANSTFVPVRIVNCSNGFSQETVPIEPNLFTCTECTTGQYTMKRKECVPCELGATCLGQNNVTIDYLWFGLETPDGYLETSICPIGFCCQKTGGCNYLTGRSYSGTDYSGVTMCAPGRDPDVPLCGRCIKGLSETNSPTGGCALCNDSSGFAVSMLLPLIGGLFAIMFWMRNGLKPKQDIPLASIVYFSKTLVFVYQLLPYLTFQSPSSYLSPLASIFNFQIQAGGGNVGNCQLAGMTSVQKLFLDLAPTSGFCVNLCILGLGIRFKFGKTEESKRWYAALQQTAWQVGLLMYTKVTATVLKILNCRTLGTVYGQRMSYAGEYKCWEHTFQWISVGLLILVVGVPIYVYYQFRKIMRREHSPESPGGWRGLRTLYPALVLPYRKSAWWYPSIVISRAFFVILVSSTSSGPPDVAATYLALVMAVVLGIHVFVQPYYHAYNNALETFGLFCAFVVTVMNVMLNPPTFFSVASSFIAFGPAVPAIYMISHFMYEKGPVELQIAIIYDPNDPKQKSRSIPGLRRQIALPQWIKPWKGKELHVINRKEAAAIYKEAIDSNKPLFFDSATQNVGEDETQPMHKRTMSHHRKATIRSNYLSEWRESDSRTWLRSITKSEIDDSFSKFERFVKEEAQIRGKQYKTLKEQGIDFREVLREEKIRQARSLDGLALPKIKNKTNMIIINNNEIFKTFEFEFVSDMEMEDEESSSGLKLGDNKSNEAEKPTNIATVEDSDSGSEGGIQQNFVGQARVVAAPAAAKGLKKHVSVLCAYIYICVIEIIKINPDLFACFSKKVITDTPEIEMQDVGDGTQITTSPLTAVEEEPQPEQEPGLPSNDPKVQKALKHVMNNVIDIMFSDLTEESGKEDEDEDGDDGDDDEDEDEDEKPAYKLDGLLYVILLLIAFFEFYALDDMMKRLRELEGDSDDDADKKEDTTKKTQPKANNSNLTTTVKPAQTSNNKTQPQKHADTQLTKVINAPTRDREPTPDSKVLLEALADEAEIELQERHSKGVSDEILKPTTIVVTDTSKTDYFQNVHSEIDAIQKKRSEQGATGTLQEHDKFATLEDVFKDDNHAVQESTGLADLADQLFDEMGDLDLNTEKSN
ncbi:adhesin-like protein [Reticulomyxa filosa]|uniref:Adhesin-like protein n=1 Tax=Reticulomyxa filosa TaxID=46433 RepID=X6MMW1_RETFI|nr:adhesin-like protein [Reticulomyxa filosa]|eukprot:ETO14991.1 adhesin-like protein [Reticulomyxa filosa]